MSFPRLISHLIDDPELSDKMVLVAGPRQVGKTTLAKQWLARASCDDLYYNWDDERVRRAYRKDPHFFESTLREKGRSARLVFDEIHKVPHWKTVLKGYYDYFSPDFHFLACSIPESY